MCGILGAIPSVEPMEFQTALRSLAHRGPDGERVWQDGERVILGHRRLAIFDPSQIASQPMQYLGRYNIVFNGEIYNFLEIRRELEGLGYRFQSSSDTEVLVAAFAHWGHHSLNRLNGMWALAIWDSYEKKLFLSRDRMGEKPLFYIHDGARFIFASEQKALLPFLKEVRPSARFHSLCKNPYAYEGTEDSLFHGIVRFPAAHYAWFANGNFRKVQYWTAVQQAVTIPSKYAEQVELLRELLLDSCRLRMRADVPIGTGLSGGIDSSAVAAAIAVNGKRRGGERAASNWQNAFVASFPKTIMDESMHARAVSDHLGIPLSEIAIEPSGHVDRLENWAYLFEEIHEVNPIPHIILYEEMRKRGVLVSLDGHGGDELFCGYESSVLHALPSATPRADEMGMVLDTYYHVHPQNSQFRGMTPFQIVMYLARSRGRKLFKPKGAGTFNKSGVVHDSLNSHLLDLSFRTVLPTLLRNYDRYSMISGVEIRIPLLDHRIVDFAFSIPWQSKIRNGFTKAVLRDAVAPWLPSGIIERKTKIGFAPPIIDWMRGPLREYLLDEINSMSFRQASLIESSRLGSSLNALIRGAGPATLYSAEQVWKEFGIYLWEKAFLQKRYWKSSQMPQTKSTMTQAQL